MSRPPAAGGAAATGNGPPWLPAAHGAPLRPHWCSHHRPINSRPFPLSPGTRQAAVGSRRALAGGLVSLLKGSLLCPIGLMLGCQEYGGGERVKRARMGGAWNVKAWASQRNELRLGCETTVAPL